MDMYTGAVLHFPAGTYADQVADDWGLVELDLMQVAWRMWYLIDQVSLDKYSGDDMKFISRMEGKEDKKKLARLVALAWGEKISTDYADFAD